MNPITATATAYRYMDAHGCAAVRVSLSTHKDHRATVGVSDRGGLREAVVDATSIAVGQALIGWIDAEALRGILIGVPEEDEIEACESIEWSASASSCAAIHRAAQRIASSIDPEE